MSGGGLDNLDALNSEGFVERGVVLHGGFLFGFAESLGTIYSLLLWLLGEVSLRM